MMLVSAQVPLGLFWALSWIRLGWTWLGLGLGLGGLGPELDNSPYSFLFDLGIGLACLGLGTWTLACQLKIHRLVPIDYESSFIYPSFYMYYRDESMLEKNCKRLEDNLIVLFRYQSPTHISYLKLISAVDLVLKISIFILIVYQLKLVEL